MSLPLITAPEFPTNIPSTGQEIWFRPFLVKEEKVLFMALESKNEDQIHKAVSTVLKNCIITEDIEVEKLATFDIEYLFLQLRSKSVDDVIKLKFRHGNTDECKKLTEVNIAVNDISMELPENSEGKIQLTDDVGIKLRYPDYSLTKKYSKLNTSDLSLMIKFIAECVEYIYDQEKLYDQSTLDEKVNFIESLSQSQFKKMTEFFETIPSLEYNVEYTCEGCGKEEKITLRGLSDFFM